MQMDCGRYVGRVGALAVALGVGSAVAAPAGIAWATSEGGAESSPSAATSTSAGGAAAHDTTSGTSKPKQKKSKSADPSAGSSSTAADTDATAKPKPAQPKPKKSSAKSDPAKAAAVAATAKATQSPAATVTAATSPTAAATGAQSAMATAAKTPVATAATAGSAAASAATLAATQPVSTHTEQTTTPVASIGALIRPVLTSILGMLDNAVANSPLGWLLLGAARREVGTTQSTATTVAAVALTASQTVAAASTNQPPTATVTWGRPDATTGTVLGQVTTSDPEGKPVALGLVSGPSAGTVAYNATTHVITFTPTTAQRYAAGLAPDTKGTVAMTLSVSDGVVGVAVPVNIPVSPSPFTTMSDITAATSPSAVATAGTRLYIASRDTGTVTAYDTVNGTVVGTYQVGAAPDGIAVNASGSRLYVSSSTGNTVTVVNTTTGKAAATLTVVDPTAITINASGSTVYVASAAGGSITKISTSTNTVAGVVKLAAGLTPRQVVVSADGKQIYVASANTVGGGEISTFTSTGTAMTNVADIAGAPTGLTVGTAYPAVFVAADDGTVTMINRSTLQAVSISLSAALSGITLSKDNSVAFVTTTSGTVAAFDTVNNFALLGFTTVRGDTTAASVQPTVVLSTDGTQMFMADTVTDTVHVVSLVPPNVPPFSNAPYYSVSNASTGAVAGTVGVVDFDGDPLTYTVTAKPTKGTLAFNADGTYTYTPNAAARHAAAVPGAPTSVTQDSFSITVSDGRNGTLSETIPITITPANKVPVVTTTIGNPNTSTGVIKGTVASTDGDGDKRTYTVTAATKGTVTVTSSGAFTYTPNAAARAAALAPGATHDDKMDTFTITVDDGHGGVVPATVNVKIGVANVKPTGATTTITSTDPRSGVVTGTISATDPDGDTLAYAASKTTKGTMVINSDGSYTYTPTDAARLAASKTGATAATKSETVTITVSDGFGGSTTTSVKLSIAPNPTTNTAPTNGRATVDSTSTALGTVTGTITADDAEGDTLTYSLASGPASGTVKVTSTGQFAYTPNVDARYLALAVPTANTDSFVVNIRDPFGASATATVNVTIAPPSTTAIDQRATTVGVTTQQMYFYTQADTDKAMAVLKGAGVDTIRIMLPWAGVEPTEGTYDWAAVDRMVNSANANGIKVLATINTTPDWAVAAGQPQYSGRPADLTQVAGFMTAVATRYQGQIADYEIWNEENYNGFWAPSPDAAQYTALLKVAYTAIKAADPNAMVIAGGIAAVNEIPGGPAINPVTFLTEMYADGAAGYFDALAFHPYQYAVQFSAGEGHAGVPITQAEQLHAVMVANGDGNKKIWATEYGEPTSEVSDASQAAFIGDFLRTWRTLDYAGPAFIQTLTDYTADSAADSTMGLLTADWTPRPALGVVEQVIAENTAIVAGENL